MNLADTPRTREQPVIYHMETTAFVPKSFAEILEREVNYWRNELMMLKERLNEK